MEIKYLKTGQFATALGVSAASIAMALKNEKLIREDNKTYDIENPINLLWINNMVSKGKEFDLSLILKKQSKKLTPRPKKVIQKKTIVGNEEKEEDLPPEMETVQKPTKKSNENYVEKKRRLELKRIQNQVVLDDLKIKKIKGQLIPYDAVKTVFLYAVETIDTTYNQEVDSLANIFIKRLDGSHDQFIELKQLLAEKLIAIKLNAKEHLLQGLKGIQSEYQEVRARGERK